MISDLALAKDDYMIKVRIIRLWKQIRMIGMILMDERGAKIECNVDRPFASLQGKTLEEYGDYYIQKPTIGLNNGAIKGHEVFVTLWGRYAEEIVAYVSKHHGHFVMIIQLAKFKNIRRMYLP
uniref:Replication protein A 70 kDa DNA-binding subunit B/D first OB fold domain-containing protein n=1 Tax=Lactuca sativa TaxID=4236 RepID=A0A9R1VNN6_LACSA|nr:hypothetical protein LSAT_V11C400225870 [Lactuca sativa]